MQILIASSDVMHVRMTRFLLEEEGHKVFQSFRSDTALKILETESVDLILLDTYCDDIGGFALCTEIRSQYSLPIMFIAADAHIKDKVTGLKIGGDDYIVRPFDPQELFARIEAVMRRYGDDFSNTYVPLSVGSVHLDPIRRQVIINNKSGEDLTAREFQLLYYLVQNARRILSSRQLLHKIWGLDYDLDSNLVPVYIGRLRRKIESDPLNPQHIVRVRDLGYCFRP